MKHALKTLACALIACPVALHAGPLTIEHTFAAGTPARAADVNANFSAVKDAVDDNDSRITAAESALSGKQARVTGTCGAGEAIRQINANGTVACETGGSGSGVDADTLDGTHSTGFAASGQSCSSGLMTGIDATGHIICAPDVHFSVRYNAPVPFPSNCAITPLTFDTNTTVIDNEGSALNTTDGEFTAPMAGTYTFSGGARITGLTAGDLIYLEIRAAGTNYNAPWLRASGAEQTLSNSITVHLDAGESASLRAYACATGGSPSLYGHSAAWAWTYFSGARVF